VTGATSRRFDGNLQRYTDVIDGEKIDRERERERERENNNTLCLAIGVRVVILQCP